MSTKFTIPYLTFTIIEDEDPDYFIVMSSGRPRVISDKVRTGDVLGLGGRLWYKFLKEPMFEETYEPDVEWIKDIESDS